MVEAMAGSDRPRVGRTADQAPGAEGGGRTLAGAAAAGGRWQHACLAGRTDRCL